MRMIAIAAVMALALSGCVSTAPKVQEVLVPVPVPCKVAIPDRPALAVDSLPVGSGIWEQMKALRAERSQRQGYETELEAAVKSCQEGPENTPIEPNAVQYSAGKQPIHRKDMP
jgi:hypothetical protein